MESITTKQKHSILKHTSEFERFILSQRKKLVYSTAFVLLELRMRLDKDGTSAFSRVTGEQPLVLHKLLAIITQRSW